MPLDSMLIEHLEPMLVSLYLSAHGWQIAETYPDKSTRWAHATDNSRNITFPTDSIQAKTADQKRELVNVLATQEGRSAQEILMELVHSGADHLRVNLQRPETSRGTLALDNAARISQGLNKLLTALAWAMLEPRPFLAGKKPAQVSKYSRTLEIGPNQAENGYTIHVLSPLEDIDQDSFSRQALLSLVNTLGAVRMALEMHTLTPDQLGQLVAQYITADLCEALVLILGKPSTKKRNRSGSISAREVRFDFDWSPTLSVPSETPNQVIFQSELAESLQELAERLRETRPHENFQLQGWVIDLKRSDQTGLGKVTVNNQNRDTVPKVSIELESEQYDLAIQAHRDNVPIICVGTLIKDKRTFVLLDPSVALAGNHALSRNVDNDAQQPEVVHM